MASSVKKRTSVRSGSSANMTGVVAVIFSVGVACASLARARAASVKESESFMIRVAGILAICPRKKPTAWTRSTGLGKGFAYS